MSVERSENPQRTEPAIDVRGLRKSFGRFEALRGLDLEVARGEVHGFLGPNGAGKSTTIRVLLGLLRADGGEVRLLGGDPWRDVVELHRRLAYVPGDVALWPTMTGGEMIDLLGSMRGGLDEGRRADLVSRFELDTSKRGRQYSKGNRQKVAIVAALASDVELLILDEPTSGLDPLMENVFQEVVGRPPLAVPPCCCRVTSSPRRRPWRTGSASSATGPSWRPAPWPSCAGTPALPFAPNWIRRRARTFSRNCTTPRCTISIRTTTTPAGSD